MNDRDWWIDLQDFLLMQRNSPHSVTGRAPAELMINRLLRDKIPASIEMEQDRDEELADRDWAIKERGKQQNDKKRRARESDLDIGDRVLVKRMHKANKLIPNFNPNPCFIVNREGGEVVVEATSGNQYVRNVAHVKRFNDGIGTVTSDNEVTKEHPRQPEQEQDVDTPSNTLQFIPSASSTPATKPRSRGQGQESASKWHGDGRSTEAPTKPSED